LSSSAGKGCPGGGARIRLLADERAWADGKGAIVVRGQASQRWPAATGLIAAALLLAALVTAPEPVWPEEQAGGLTTTFYATYETRLRLQALLLALAVLVFLWFVGILRAFLARVEPGGAPLASVAAAAGVVTVVLGLLDAAVLTALIDLRGAELSSKAQGSAWAARSLFYLEDALSSALFLPVLVLVVATSLAVLRTGVLPRWLGLAGVVLATLLLFVLVLRPSTRSRWAAGSPGSWSCSGWVPSAPLWC
jgi:hypothetical protein